MGLISKPLRERFGIHLRFNFYNVESLKQILHKGSSKVLISIDDEGAEEIAKRSRGTPRIALRLLKRIRDFAIYEDKTTITKSIAITALEKLDIDKHGLDGGDYRYLMYIYDKCNKGPVGIETIAAALSEAKDTIEETIEPYLLQQGFIQKTPRGRVLSEFAIEYLMKT